LIGKDEGDGCEGIIRRYTGKHYLQPQVRVEALNNSVPVIPLEHIKQWLEHSTILPASRLQYTLYRWYSRSTCTCRQRSNRLCTWSRLKMVNVMRLP
jgi:hypothetical protein